MRVRGNKSRRLYRNMRCITITAYIVVIINLTLWPPIIGQPISWSEISFNIVPFDSILASLNHSYSLVGIRNVFGNIILL